MENVNNQLTTLCLIDNFGYTRTANDEITFHCFIAECRFVTTNMGELLDHQKFHNEKWFGFCYACDAQVYDKKVLLMTELKHLNIYHTLHKNGITIPIPPSEDKQTKLKEAVNIARAQRVTIEDDDSAVDDNFEIVLKPWTRPTTVSKPQNKCREMLIKTRLCALYKCMEINCAFATSCAETMLTHLQDHENCSTTRSENWLECAYCERISDSCSSLVQHIRDEHSSSLYQCPYCFYRSCVPRNVVFHLKQFHESRKTSVLVCNGNFTAEAAAIEWKNIRPLRCSGGKQFIKSNRRLSLQITFVCLRTM